MTSCTSSSSPFGSGGAGGAAPPPLLLPPLPAAPAPPPGESSSSSSRSPLVNSPQGSCSRMAVAASSSARSLPPCSPLAALWQPTRHPFAACAARLLPASAAAPAVRCPSHAPPCLALHATLLVARHPALPTMASLNVLTFDHEGHPIQFDTWLDDLHLYLLSDSRDSVSLFDPHWLTRDAAPRLAVRNHLPLAERAHFGQHKIAKPLYNAVVARYSSPATAAPGRLLLPYLFPELFAFATVEDLVTHLRTSDAHYRAALPAEFLDRNPPPIYITLYFIVTRLPDSLRAVRDHFLAIDPTDLTVDLLEQHLLAAETSVVAVGAARGTPRTPFFEGCSPSPLAPSYASAAAVDILGAEDVGAASALSGKRHSSKGNVCCPYAIRTGDRAGQTCGKPHSHHHCFSRLDDAWREEFGDKAECPHWAELLRSGVDIFALEYDAILAAMYALSVSAEGDCYLCVPPDPGIKAAALGASESALPGTRPAEALHTFTLESGASRCFFRDSTTLTPPPAHVPVGVADPSGGPVLARSSSVLPCPAVPFGSLSGLHLPSFSTNLVSTAALQDAMVTTTTPGGQRVSICTCTQTGRHMATFTRRPGSSLYTLTTEPPQVAVSAHVSASGQVAPPSCRTRLSNGTTALVTPPFPAFVACTPASLFLVFPHLCLPSRPRVPRLAFLASRGGSAPLLTPRFPRRLLPCRLSTWTCGAQPNKGEVPDVLIPWIRAVRLQLCERFREDLPVLHLHYDRGGEFSSDLLRDFCRGEGILESFPLPSSPQQNGIAERRIGLVIEVARTSMIHAAAPHFLWPFAVRYTAHQLNLWPRVSLPETLHILRWTGKVGDASVFRFYHTTSRRFLPSQDVTFDESVSFYCLFPYRSAPLPPPPLFLAPGPPPVDPLPPQDPAPSGVSQVDPLPGTVPVEVAVDSGAARGTASRSATSGGAEPVSAEPGGAEPAGAEREGAEPGGAEPGGVEPEGAEPGGPEPEVVEPGGAESEGAGSEGAEPRATASSGGPAAAGAGDSAAGSTGAGGAGATSLGGAGVPAGAGGTGAGGAGAGDPGTGGARAGGSGVGSARAGEDGAGDPGAGGARAGGTRARGTGAGGAGAGGARAGDPSARGAGAIGTSAGGAGAGGTRAVDPGAGGAEAGGAASSGTVAGGSVQR
ncbi:unnamed protein product [Closterium sp. NIES-53]